MPDPIPLNAPTVRASNDPDFYDIELMTDEEIVMLAYESGAAMRNAGIWPTRIDPDILNPC